MKKYLKLVAFITVCIMLTSIMGQPASARKQDNPKEMIFKTLGQDVLAYKPELIIAKMHDMEGLSLYKEALDKLGIAEKSTQKIRYSQELLNEFEQELQTQYVFVNWNQSKKLLEIKHKLTIDAVYYIDSKIYNDDTTLMLVDALKHFFIADRILCQQGIDDLRNITSSESVKKIPGKATGQLNAAEINFENAEKSLHKGSLVSAAVLYRNAYEKALEGLNCMGLSYDVNLLESGIDSDQDLIPDGIELLLGTNPFNPDTDNDGLDDFAEINLYPYCSPINPDTDGDGTLDPDEDSDNDGLSNILEVSLDTDPANADTDGDGLSDGFEILEFMTDPLKFDTDEDGLSDGDEYVLGTNPLLVDTNGNGITDDKEIYSHSIVEEYTVETGDKLNIVENVVVSFSAVGNAAAETQIINTLGRNMVTSNAVGRVGYPVDIVSTSEFSTAVISFSYAGNLPEHINEDELGILWFNEKENSLELLNSTLDKENKTVSVETSHFSEYLLIDKQTWFDAWRQELNYERVKNYDIAFAIDSSGSMAWNDPNGLRKTAAKQFVDAFLPDDQGAVIDLDSSAYLRIHLTKNRESIKSAIDSINSSGGTNINSAVNLCIDELTSSYALPDNEKIIILLTDGDGTYYSSTTQRAKNNDITIYTVGLGSAVNSTLLSNIASQTGGEYYHILNSSDLIDAFDSIRDETIGDTTDSDLDGLYDTSEQLGMRNQYGEIIKTNPNNLDSDDDELEDGVEMGDFVQVNVPPEIASRYNIQTYSYYKMISYPNKADSDGDGINDFDDDDPLYNDFPFISNVKSRVTKILSSTMGGKAVLYIADSLGYNIEEKTGEFLTHLVEKLRVYAIDEQDLQLIVLGISCSIDDNILGGLIQYVAYWINGFQQPDYDFWFMKAKAATDATFTAWFAVSAYGSAAAALQALTNAGLFSGFAIALTPTGYGVVVSGTIAIEEAVRGAVLLGISAVSTAMFVRSGKIMSASVNKLSKTVQRAPSSRKLGRNLENANLGERSVRPTHKHASHHIVAGYSRKAADTRKILKKFGVGINDAINGVFLPTTKGVSPACYHPKLHTNAYYNTVHSMLKQASSKSEVISILNKIADMLLKGTFPH